MGDGGDAELCDRRDGECRCDSSSGADALDVASGEDGAQRSADENHGDHGAEGALSDAQLVSDPGRHRPEQDEGQADQHHGARGEGDHGARSRAHGGNLSYQLTIILRAIYLTGWLPSDRKWSAGTPVRQYPAEYLVTWT